MGEIKKIMGAESIITNDMCHCYVCGSPNVEIHHIIFGTANRDLSDKFGLIVPLCSKHHRTGKHAVHKDINANLFFKKMAQEQFKKHFPQYDFIEIFGKDWLDKED